MAHVPRQLGGLLAQPGLRNGLERSDDAEISARHLRELDRLADRLGGGV